VDPDRRVALEEERDFLLQSIRDLDAELAAGDLDTEDHRTLTADYTARAADVLRSLETGGAGEPDEAPDERRSPLVRRLLAVGGVVALAALAGVLVMQASGERGSSGLTGLDVSAASARFDDCQLIDQRGEAEEAMDCYSEILESLPINVPALTFRGWLQIREFDLDDGLDDLDAAVQLDPDATAARVFRAIGRSRSGDPVGVIADLAAFEDADPSAEERRLASQIEPPVEEALDLCIDGDVTGSIPPVEVVDCYRNVLTVDPGNPTASVYLGWLLARSGADDQARALLDDGLAEDPSLAAGYVFRAALLAHLGEIEAARADLRTFSGLDSTPDQQAAADRVRAAIDAGEDPLPGS
jgi:tetratricopeptide (TPR) repeat protein